MRDRTKSRFILAAIAALTIAGGAAAAYGTANGPWGYSDSAAYLSLARNVLDGAGLGYYSPAYSFEFLAHYPPLYPLLLAGAGGLGLDLVDAARWLSILLFAATTFGAGWIFLRLSAAPVLAIPASLLMAAFPAAIMMFTSAMSEPLFVCLLIWSGYFLLGYLARRNERWLVLSAVAAGLLPVTRYIGIAFLVSAIAAIFAFMPGRWPERFGKAALFGAIAGLPVIAWSAWVFLGTGRSIAGRGIHVDWAGLAAQFREFRTLFLDTVWYWIPLTKYPSGLPYWLRYLLLGLSAAAVIGLIAWTRRRAARSRLQLGGDSRIFGLFGMSAIAYAAFLTLAYLFTLPTPDVNARMLLPLFACLLLSLLAAFGQWSVTLAARQRLWWQGSFLAAIVLIAAWYLPRSTSYLTRFHRGEGTTAYSWRDSETMQAVRDLLPGLTIVSNNEAAILAWTNRPGYEVLENLEPGFVEAEAPYGSSTTDPAQRAFREGGAALVIFSGFPEQLERDFGEAGRIRAETILEGLVIYGEYQDGVIYFYSR